MKLPELMEFVSPYALPMDNKKEERTLDSQTKSTMNTKKDVGFKFIDSVEKLTSTIIDTTRGGLVLYIDKSQPSNEEYMQLVGILARAFGHYINLAVYQVDAAHLFN
jgi:hypothetical protein